MKKAPTLMSTPTATMGASTRVSEMPEALMAVSSNFSPMSPRVIMEESRVASGMASGSVWILPHIRNSRITLNSRPFPTSSSMYSQRNCRARMKMTMARIAKNGPTKDFNMNLSSLFMPISGYVL